MARITWLTFACIWLWCCVLQGHPDTNVWSPLNSIRDQKMGDIPVFASTSEGDVCSDMDIRNSVVSFRRLENCSVVEGSVQILLIDKAQKTDFENMTFPKLREITGYLLLYRVQGLQSLSKLFPNLAVIRGDMLFHNYALVIYEMRAIQDVGLVSLTTILRGSVRIEKNPHLCYVDTIDWDIIAKAGRNGHFIKENKPNSQCPKTCPEADCPSSRNIKFSGEQKLCWNSHTCQKVCAQQCELSNLTCSSYNKCCHKECLGGCSGSLSSECIACRNVVFQGKCQLHCPPGTYKYLNRRCIQEEACKKISNRLSISPVDNQVYWKPFKGECLPHCPTGYSVNDSDKHQCIKCEGLCPKICSGAVIDSVGSAQKLKGCTFVNGSLEIQIQGGDSIIKELESSLSHIQEIRGYLKIARSYPLISLNFLRDLWHIRGEQLDKKEYAFLVLDNQNLQELWDWSNRKTKLRISGGKVFFHFNSKLCLSKINELRNHSYVMDWDERDVSPSSNGDRVACDVVDLEITVWGVKSAVAGLQWKNFRKYRSDIDFRSLLGYVVYYREAEHNVTIFDGRDACGADEWKVDDVEADNDANEVITLLTHLKPHTRYAVYMRTYTVASALVGAQSNIIYFTTTPDTPSAPVDVNARAESHNEIVIQWNSPKKPNGNITHYIVDGIREKDSSEFISQRNYCNEPLIPVTEIKKSIQDKNLNPHHIYTIDANKAKESKSGDCCPCTKTKTLSDDDDDAQFQIKFEDYLQNNVFYKNPNAVKFKYNVNVTRALRPTYPPHRNVTDYFNETFTRVPATFSSSSPSEDVSSEPSSTPSSFQDEHHFHYEVYNDFFLVVKNLHHFTEYTIEVKACQDPLTTENDPCSPQSITTIRTRPKSGADDIDINSIRIAHENLTYGVLNLKWEEPKDYNGLIVNYYIEIKSSDYKPIPVCVTQLEYQKLSGYTMYDLMPGNYSLRLKATSLAGPGNWTTPIYFTIPNSKGGMKAEIVALLVICVVFIVCLAFGVPFYFYYKKRYGNDMPTMLYASVNPEYMSAVYEPDEWEVPRENIKLLQELGQGSFGMVYKGEYTNDEQRVMNCAVKTVNESASLRERIEFLQEASVMKAFNCHHVVKLLGVVSKGHPTFVIMELMGKGDLKAYLRSRRPDNEENIDNPNAQPPTLKEILQMAVEIADGMAYLAAKKFVHRDLAARNCMVSDDVTVKIGDFGMTRDIYETDYYRKGGKGLLPVRWMAPECLKDGLFSSQSDIWSYGVVLWEMATLASQPYQGLSNEQVLQYVISGGKMTKPENCPEKLYAIMDLCWDKNPKARPTFIELIDMLLPDINETKFREMSFYYTQRQETCTKENELCDSATASTPMRTQWMENQNSRDESDGESEVTFFPPTRNSFASGNYHDQGAKGVHSTDNSKGMSVTSSDDSKGSKISSASNGSIANGHVTFAPGRTTMC